MDACKTGAFIALLRRESDMTQKQLAERLRVSDKAVSRWETGRGYPDVESLTSLSEVFGISINELLTGERVFAEQYKVFAENNIVDVYKKERKVRRRLIVTVILASAATVAVTAAAVVFAYIYIAMAAVQLESTRAAHEYPETAVVKGRYILQTIRTDKGEDDIPALTFTVLDENTGACLYKTEESWRTWDLNSIAWDPYSYNVIVDSSDVGTSVYIYEVKNKSWFETEMNEYGETEIVTEWY